jgi:hypothetical protein
MQPALSPSLAPVARPSRSRASTSTDGCACLSAGRHGDHGGGCPDICRAKAVRRTRGGERRAPGPQRCGNRNRGLHLRRGREEMHLQAAQGVSLMFTRGNSEAARVALNQSLAIAQQRRDAPNQLQLLSLLHMFHHRIGDFKTTLHYAKRSSVVADSTRHRVGPFPFGEFTPPYRRSRRRRRGA